ncbi:MAG: hypothetical protein M3R62_06860, partial [Acidobacteriota bacterium]|nr:hypothetical protein [Acidobacteriota bacterium]
NWASSPFRSFAAARPLLAGIQLVDEADSPSFRAALASDLRRLKADLHERQGWADPFSEGDPLRIYFARGEAQGVRRLSARGVDRHRLVAPSIQIDGSGMTSREAIHQVARLYALAVLESYGVADDTFLSASVAEALSVEARGDDASETLRIAAAAPSIDVARQTDSLGRMYVEEFARAAGGNASLRLLWEKASLTGEGVLPLFLRSWTEATGEREEVLLLRAAARLYTVVEPEASPSRVALSDLESRGLDAATPATFSVRHRTFLPAADASGALRIAWPERSAPAAAIVRYREASLPPDVVFWKSGSTRTIPLSGVSRVDWVVAGVAGGPPLEDLSAPVQSLTSFPFGAISPQAAAGPGSPRISWTTSGHEGLAGWALFREEVLADGRIARTGPQMLPATAQADESYRYAYLDSEVSPGTFYRYSVWAVTEDGLLAKAFSATLHTAE